MHLPARGKAASPYRPLPFYPETSPDFLDCSGASWTEAFDEMHAKFSSEYVFTEWRGIDWQGLKNKFEPKIKSAEKNNDESAYYAAIREYFTSFHDGHVALIPADELTSKFVANEVRDKIGGGYGLLITKTDRDGFIISYLSPETRKTSLKLGDEVMFWNNVPIKQAVECEPITWSDEIDKYSHGTYTPATIAGIEYEKIRLLTRGRFRSLAHHADYAIITVFRHATNEFITATLEAADDQMKTLDLTNLFTNIGEHSVDYKILPSGLVTCRL